MSDAWKLAAVLAAAGVAGAWLLVARGLRRRRLAALEPVARGLGLVFHGDSFRGRFRGHAVRGDGGSDIPRQVGPPGGSARDSLVGPFMVGRKAVRVRVELTSPEVSRPETQKAAAAARRELEQSGIDEALCEVSLQGTELVFVLRDDAATAGAVRAVVEGAIEAAKGGGAGEEGP